MLAAGGSALIIGRNQRGAAHQAHRSSPPAALKPLRERIPGIDI